MFVDNKNSDYRTLLYKDIPSRLVKKLDEHHPWFREYGDIKTPNHRLKHAYVFKKEPGLLFVNGIPLPLTINPNDGRFSSETIPDYMKENGWINEMNISDLRNYEIVDYRGMTYLNMYQQNNADGHFSPSEYDQIQIEEVKLSYLFCCDYESETGNDGDFYIDDRGRFFKDKPTSGRFITVRHNKGGISRIKLLSANTTHKTNTNFTKNYILLGNDHKPISEEKGELELGLKFLNTKNSGHRILVEELTVDRTIYETLSADIFQPNLSVPNSSPVYTPESDTQVYYAEHYPDIFESEYYRTSVDIYSACREYHRPKRIYEFNEFDLETKEPLYHIRSLRTRTLRLWFRNPKGLTPVLYKNRKIFQVNPKYFVDGNLWCIEIEVLAIYGKKLADFEGYFEFAEDFYQKNKKNNLFTVVLKEEGFHYFETHFSFYNQDFVVTPDKWSKGYNKEVFLNGKLLSPDEWIEFDYYGAKAVQIRRPTNISDSVVLTGYNYQAYKREMIPYSLIFEYVHSRWFYGEMYLGDKLISEKDLYNYSPDIHGLKIKNESDTITIFKYYDDSYIDDFENIGQSSIIANRYKSTLLAKMTPRIIDISEAKPILKTPAMCEVYRFIFTEFIGRPFDSSIFNGTNLNVGYVKSEYSALISKYPLVFGSGTPNSVVLEPFLKEVMEGLSNSNNGRNPLYVYACDYIHSIKNDAEAGKIYNEQVRYSKPESWSHINRKTSCHRGRLLFIKDIPRSLYLEPIKAGGITPGTETKPITYPSNVVIKESQKYKMTEIK